MKIHHYVALSLGFHEATIIWSFFFVHSDSKNKTKVILKRAITSKAARAVLVPNPKARLFDQVRKVMRFHLWTG